ncbi:MAG TPA: hypothetical protein VJ969_07915 [Desulfopila sp.]|nr:hypothetical protein [Desulfopila sp.]
MSDRLPEEKKTLVTSAVLPAVSDRSYQHRHITLSTMAKKIKQKKKELVAEKRELAMIEGILEGSPEGIGVVVVRLECGCRKMAAVSNEGEPASKVIIYRDEAESVCDKCKEDDGAFMRVTESFIHWVDPQPEEEQKQRIHEKVIGTSASTTH